MLVFSHWNLRKRYPLGVPQTISGNPWFGTLKKKTVESPRIRLQVLLPPTGGGQQVRRDHLVGTRARYISSAFTHVNGFNRVPCHLFSRPSDHCTYSSPQPTPSTKLRNVAFGGDNVGAIDQVLTNQNCPRLRCLHRSKLGNPRRMNPHDRCY